MSARPRGPQPSGPRAPGPREKTCCWSASSWLHLLRSWSLRSTRGGSGCRRPRFLGLFTEYEWGSQASLIVFLALYFLFLWVSWVLAEWVTRPKTNTAQRA